MMNGYERRSLKKREKIIATAQRLFLSYGLSNVTMEQIAKEAQVSRVTIFKYFGDREGLDREVLLAWANVLLAEYDKILESDLSFHIKLAQILQLKMTGLSETNDEAMKFDIRTNAELLSYVREIVTNLGLSKIMALIVEGKQVGAIDSTLDDEAIRLYFSAFSPIISNPDYIKKSKPVQESLFNMFMSGLIKDWPKYKDSFYSES